MLSTRGRFQKGQFGKDGQIRHNRNLVENVLLLRELFHYLSIQVKIQTVADKGGGGTRPKKGESPNSCSNLARLPCKMSSFERNQILSQRTWARTRLETRKESCHNFELHDYRPNCEHFKKTFWRANTKLWSDIFFLFHVSTSQEANHGKAASIRVISELTNNKSGQTKRSEAGSLSEVLLDTGDVSGDVGHADGILYC